jgi:hypothetical protein
MLMLAPFGLPMTLLEEILATNAEPGAIITSKGGWNVNEGLPSTTPLPPLISPLRNASSKNWVPDPEAPDRAVAVEAGDPARSALTGIDDPPDAPDE